MEYEVLVIDSTKTPIERPKKSRGDFIPVRNTLKTQLIIGRQNKKIIFFQMV
ncbi:MAG: hypothetical protein sL5_08590 [Candidatus Mesenet longicola]|uniref:Transposase n=1 Tax=Candidatus Mesenet longicola TaxID=1892558 RepID=A0A8J3HYG2_9RICK|nr:MAG: hypothetical protein sGL2_08930 [Candidatus Mesenet longicola]GHM59866.1 MAG: hypothetical protein sL5_08590 [Candidatus Mesenet longicola]